MFARKGGSVDGPDGAWSYATGCSIRWNDFIRDDQRSAADARRLVEALERLQRNKDRRSSDPTIERYNARIDEANAKDKVDKVQEQLIELLRRHLGPSLPQLTVLATSADLTQIVTPSRQRLWKILPCLHGLARSLRGDVNKGVVEYQKLNPDKSRTLEAFEKSKGYAQQCEAYELAFSAYRNVEDLAQEQGALSDFIQRVNSDKLMQLHPLDRKKTGLAGLLRRRRRSRKSRRWVMALNPLKKDPFVQNTTRARWYASMTLRELIHVFHKEKLPRLDPESAALLKSAANAAFKLYTDLGPETPGVANRFRQTLLLMIVSGDEPTVKAAIVRASREIPSAQALFEEAAFRANEVLLGVRRTAATRDYIAVLEMRLVLLKAQVVLLEVNPTDRELAEIVRDLVLSLNLDFSTAQVSRALGLKGR